MTMEEKDERSGDKDDRRKQITYKKRKTDGVYITTDQNRKAPS